MPASVERADPRAEDRVGSVLNEKWTLERLLGEGGMAAVYAGRHRNGARAAVKVLHPDLARVDEVRDRFLREGYAANRVEHRGAVQVLDDDVVKEGPDEGTAYIVMEQLEGESLEQRARREPPLTERELLAIAEAVLEVLEAAHAHGVVHRDLKPENLFLAKDSERAGTRVKVLDFGLARLSSNGPVTSAGLALGTPSYMSPEQAAGRAAEIDGRTDLFAIGATAFRLLTGKRVHEADNAVMQVVKMATQPAPRIRSVKPDVSEPFARVVDRALAFRREDRYPDASAMLVDVRSALDMLGTLGADPTLHVMPYSLRQPPARVVSDSGDANGETREAREARETALAAPALQPTQVAVPVPHFVAGAAAEASAQEEAARAREASEPSTSSDRAALAPPVAAPLEAIEEESGSTSNPVTTAAPHADVAASDVPRAKRRRSGWSGPIVIAALAGIGVALWLDGPELRAKAIAAGVPLGVLDSLGDASQSDGSVAAPGGGGDGGSNEPLVPALANGAAMVDAFESFLDAATSLVTAELDAGDDPDAGDDEEDEDEDDAGATATSPVDAGARVSTSSNVGGAQARPQKKPGAGPTKPKKHGTGHPRAKGKSRWSR